MRLSCLCTAWNLRHLPPQMAMLMSSHMWFYLACHNTFLIMKIIHVYYFKIMEIYVNKQFKSPVILPPRDNHCQYFCMFPSYSNFQWPQMVKKNPSLSQCWKEQSSERVSTWEKSSDMHLRSLPQDTLLLSRRLSELLLTELCGTVHPFDHPVQVSASPRPDWPFPGRT